VTDPTPSDFLRCEYCVYWLRGHCIRFPPVAFQGGRVWPPTMATDVCGEHTPVGSDTRNFWRLKREAENNPDPPLVPSANQD
jgi:hypothetical protein